MSFSPAASFRQLSTRRSRPISTAGSKPNTPGLLGFLRRGVAGAAVRALEHVLDTADRQNRNNEEERNKTHPLLDNKLRDCTALPTVGRLPCPI